MSQARKACSVFTEQDSCVQFDFALAAESVTPYFRDLNSTALVFNQACDESVPPTGHRGTQLS